MNNTVHHDGLAVCPSLTEGLPLKIVKHIGYTVLFVKVRLNKAGSTSPGRALNFFSGRGVRPRFPKRGACELTFASEKGGL